MSVLLGIRHSQDAVRAGTGYCSLMNSVLIFVAAEAESFAIPCQ